MDGVLEMVLNAERLCRGYIVENDWQRLTREFGNKPRANGLVGLGGYNHQENDFLLWFLRISSYKSTFLDSY